MANTWKIYTLVDNADAVKVWAQCQSDGTEETDKVLVDYSALSGTFTKLAVEEIVFLPTVGDTATYTLEFDATTDDLIWAYNSVTGQFSGVQHWEFGNPGIVDPYSTGHTSDIVLTTTGISNATVYSFLITARKVP